MEMTGQGPDAPLDQPEKGTATVCCTMVDGSNESMTPSTPGTTSVPALERTRIGPSRIDLQVSRPSCLGRVPGDDLLGEGFANRIESWSSFLGVFLAEKRDLAEVVIEFGFRIHKSPSVHHGLCS